jgi:hypothetical protein
MSPFLLLGLLLALLALAFVLYPILRPRAAAVEPIAQPAELEERRRTLYRQILDIEFDQQVGKVDETDARELTERLLHQAASLAAQQSTAEAEADAELEREILAVRRSLAAEREPRFGRVKR